MQPQGSTASVSHPNQTAQPPTTAATNSKPNVLLNNTNNNATISSLQMDRRLQLHY